MAALALSSSAPAAAQSIAPDERIFEELVVASPRSFPTGMTSSPGGKYLYVGEGATIAILDALATDGMEDPIASFTVSSQAIVPVAMLVDKAADVEDDPSPADLIFIAAGRDGLWILKDPHGTPAFFRADDSSDGDPGTQDNRRWASALDYVTIGETDYLAVLFAAIDDSYLRLYELEDLRYVAQFGTELGCEVAPARSILLRELTTNPPPPLESWYAYAFGLAVDQQGGPQDGADVFVAMGAHGIVRVRLFDQNGPPYPVDYVSQGPVFGDGSVYADTTDGPTYGFGGSGWDQRVYDDFKFYNRSLCPTGCAILERSHPPIFTDVAYHDGHVYATVESAGWFRVALSQTWGPAMVIDHHEGWQRKVDLNEEGCVASGCTGQNEGDGEEVLLSLLDDEDLPSGVMARTWTRRIVVSETPNGPVLAVSSASERIARVFWEHRHEGRYHTDPMSLLAQKHLAGDFVYTLLYRLDVDGPCNQPFCPEVENQDLWFRLGGDQIVVPPLYPPPNLVSDERVLFFATSRTNAVTPISHYLEDPVDESFGETAGLVPHPNYNNFKVISLWEHPSPPDPPEPPPATVEVRSLFHRWGHYTHEVASAKANERIFFTSNNDGMFRRGGVEWTCGSVLRSGPVPDYNSNNEPDPVDLRGDIIINPEAQWLATHQDHTGHGYHWGAWIYTALEKPQWFMQRYSPGSGLCGSDPVPPERENYGYFSSPQGRFSDDSTTENAELDRGRGYYSTGGVWPAYDIHVGQPIVFGVRSGHEWGVAVMGRDLLQDAMENNADPEDIIITEDVLGGILGTLVTAPELGQVDDYDDMSNPGVLDFITQHKLTGPTTNLHPRFFTLLDESNPQDPITRYFLVVPAGRISVDSDDGFMTGWGVPARFDSRKGHAKICIFDITDPLNFDPDGSPNIPAWTIICPQQGFINTLEVHEFGGSTWLFATDFSGELLVYDLSNLHLKAEGALDFQNFGPDERYEVMEDMTDPFRSDLYAVVLDEVEWEDEQQNQRHELYIYLGASRVGVEVLKLVPTNPLGERLEHVGIVQVPGEAGGLWIRQDPDTNERQLMVANTYGGIRVLAYNTNLGAQQ